jgi:hypothetical protein
MSSNPSANTWFTLSLMARHDGNRLQTWSRRVSVDTTTGVRFGWYWA